MRWRCLVKQELCERVECIDTKGDANADRDFRSGGRQREEMLCSKHSEMSVGRTALAQRMRGMVVE